jgi:hypothetical protein
LRDFFFAHLGRMPFIMKEDESLDPMNVALLGLWTKVSHADRLVDLVDQLRFRSAWDRLNVTFEIHPTVNDYKRAISRFVSVRCFHHRCLPYWIIQRIGVIVSS